MERFMLQPGDEVIFKIGKGVGGVVDWAKGYNYATILEVVPKHHAVVIMPKKAGLEKYADVVIGDKLKVDLDCVRVVDEKKCLAVRAARAQEQFEKSLAALTAKYQKELRGKVQKSKKEIKWSWRP